MKKRTQDFIAANRRPGLSCCSTTTADAHDAFLTLVDDARAEALAFHREFRRVRADEHPRIVGILNELDEKYKAVEYQYQKVEREIDILQAILGEIEAARERILCDAEKPVHGIVR